MFVTEKALSEDEVLELASRDSPDLIWDTWAPERVTTQTVNRVGCRNATDNRQTRCDYENDDFCFQMTNS